MLRPTFKHAAIANNVFDSQKKKLHPNPSQFLQDWNPKLCKPNPFLLLFYLQYQNKTILDHIMTVALQLHTNLILSYRSMHCYTFLDIGMGFVTTLISRFPQNFQS